MLPKKNPNIHCNKISDFVFLLLNIKLCFNGYLIERYRSMVTSTTPKPLAAHKFHVTVCDKLSNKLPATLDLSIIVIRKGWPNTPTKKSAILTDIKHRNEGWPHSFLDFKIVYVIKKFPGIAISIEIPFIKTK